MTWDDRLWQMKTGDGAITTYVLEQGETIVGFLTVHIDERARPETMTIMEIASDKGNGFGGVLIRFADTLARQSECAVVRLHAIKDRVGFYERFGYSACMGSADLSLGLEVYRPMERPVLYHHQPESTL
jgi:hypothetical protein